MPWSAVEWRLARQMNCTNAQHRPQKATGGRMLCLRQIIARGNVPWRCVQRGCRRSMETNRFHRASRYALECRRMAIGTSDELHERTAQATEGHGRQDTMFPANHRASRYALECRRMAIGTSDELHERTAQATEGHGRQDAMSPANHRARQCALEVPPEGVPTLNGNKLVPSRDLHFLKPLTHKKLLFLEPRDD